jgi:hypothetical protein
MSAGQFVQQVKIVLTQHCLGSKMSIFVHDGLCALVGCKETDENISKKSELMHFQIHNENSVPLF